MLVELHGSGRIVHPINMVDAKELVFIDYHLVEGCRINIKIPQSVCAKGAKF